MVFAIYTLSTVNQFNLWKCLNKWKRGENGWSSTKKKYFGPNRKYSLKNGIANSIERGTKFFVYLHVTKITNTCMNIKFY